MGTIIDSVAITMIPCIATAFDFLHDYSDITWSAVWPTIWMQISVGLSILTACIPGLKSILNSWLGHVASAPMDLPYELNMMDGTINLRATVTTDVYITTQPAPANMLINPWRITAQSHVDGSESSKSLISTGADSDPAMNATGLTETSESTRATSLNANHI